MILNKCLVIKPGPCGDIYHIFMFMGMIMGGDSILNGGRDESKLILYVSGVVTE